MIAKLQLGRQVKAFLKIIGRNLEMTDSQKMEVVDFYERYDPLKLTSYPIGSIFRYGVNKDNESQLYEVIDQVPSGYEGQTPDQLVGDFLRAIGFSESGSGLPIWTQPWGYEDAYDINDTVKHPERSTSYWICIEGDLDGEKGPRNSYEPGVFGWILKN